MLKSESDQNPTGFRHGLRALRHQNFRRFWVGALVSNSGSWLQNLTIPFVLFEITREGKWVGFASFAAIVPVMLLGPVAGNVADRFDRRHVLIISSLASAIPALGLWLMWESGVRSPAAIVVVAAVGGLMNGFTIPTWQSFIPLLVPVEDLPSAISLNSLQFNIARAAGPVAGGLFIATIGPGWSFFANGVSYLAVFAALVIVNPGQVRSDRQNAGVIEGFVEALHYIRSQPGIGLGIAVAIAVAGLGYPVVSFIVIFGESVYGVGALAVGLLTALLGVGSVLAAPLVTGSLGDVSRRTTVRWALPAYGASVMLFGGSTEPIQGSIAIVMVGFGFLTIVATSNIAVQSIVAERIRGRVMATRIMAFTGAFPIGALLQTTLSDRFGPRPVVFTAGLIVLVIGIALATKPALLARLDDPPDNSPDRSPEVQDS